VQKETQNKIKINLPANCKLDFICKFEIKDIPMIIISEDKIKRDDVECKMIENYSSLGSYIMLQRKKNYWKVIDVNGTWGGKD